MSDKEIKSAIKNCRWNDNVFNGLDLEYGFYEHDFVTAWMSLTQPYKAESEDKNEKKIL